MLRVAAEEGEDHDNELGEDAITVQGPSSPAVVVVSSAKQLRQKYWNSIVEGVGALAGCCTTAAFIPQVVEVALTGDTSGLSLPMYSIFVTGVAMWILYGVCKKAGSLIFANVVTFLLAGYIFYRILDNEIFHPTAAVDDAAALVGPPPSLPPLLSSAATPTLLLPPSPPLAPSGDAAHRLLADVRALPLWRALATL